MLVNFQSFLLSRILFLLFYFHPSSLSLLYCYSSICFFANRLLLFRWFWFSFVYCLLLNCWCTFFPLKLLFSWLYKFFYFKYFFLFLRIFIFIKAKKENLFFILFKNFYFRYLLVLLYFYFAEFFLKEIVSIESSKKNKKRHKTRKKASCRWRRVSFF